MARPLRIEYPGAWYHVMNRGLARGDVFWTREDGERFLALVGELWRQFAVECHAYCLMTDRYHLLLRTPRGNLGRTMRHLDGVYTQRFNRAHDRDGPIFRGRYRAIVVDPDSYLLPVSRYIHRKPVTDGLVERPEQYPWSSYRAYLGRAEPPDWLTTSTLHRAVGGDPRGGDYRRYVEAGLDEETARFYSRGRLAPVLGTAAFIDRVRTEHAGDGDPERRGDLRALGATVAIEDVMDAVAAEFGVDREALCRDGRGRDSTPRAVSMALCRTVGGHRLTDIAAAHRATSYTTVSRAVSRLRERASRDAELRQRTEQLEKRLRPHPRGAR